MKENRKNVTRRFLVTEWGCAILTGISAFLGVFFPGFCWEVRMCLCFGAVALVLLGLLRELFSKKIHVERVFSLACLLCIAVITLHFTQLAGNAQIFIRL